jgi:isoleucyl-tRNA synthetase
MNKKIHGRENDSVEVVSAVEKSEVALREEQIQLFWEEQDIFNKSVMSPAGASPKGDFTFYDGPPFATGLPHYGHILAGTIKDAIPRFWTMNGYRVRRKWGWDCHGLPLENLIEKKLGLATKRDIEEYGVKNFNEAARDAVMEYADDWKQIIPRMGRWADMENDYKTMDSTYTESVWWVFKQLHEKGLVFEGFKTMHLCPRCGTTLSNFEVNQGYKDIKDIAVTVKLPLLDDASLATDTSLLVWTTTPWTLPGNLAAAVNQEFTYVKAYSGRIDDIVEKDGDIVNLESFDKVIIAKGNLGHVTFIGNTEVYIYGEGFFAQTIEEIKGTDLVGCSYQPPFPWMGEQEMEGKENAFVIRHADYVEIGEDGTGAVHIAPAYGDDDMKLAQAHNVPIVHHVNNSGHFHDWVTDFAGQLVKPKDDDESGVGHMDADIEVLKNLQATGVIFKKENITHSYPHCWRCDTPLLNYATTSWFVDVPSIKDQLVKNNSEVKWVPEHVGTNRFGKWLDGARDWAVSRQRYWGAPLPIWKNPETGDYKVVGSLEELKEFVPKSGNQYFVMRHGESESNVAEVISANIDNDDSITSIGKEQVIKAAAELKNENIDLIIASPFMRTKQTAELIRAELGLPETALLFDEIIREYDLADEFEGGHWSEYGKHFVTWSDRYTKSVGQTENRLDVKKRMGEFLYGLESNPDYKGKNILIVSHGGPIATLQEVVQGLNVEQSKETHDTEGYFANAQWQKFDFTALPHNDNYELDFHRPYIDDVVLEENGVKLERVPDVFDCWFESGSMPYGQRHFMGEAQSDFDPANGIGLPAQFIAEGLDQTRGWFYSLIVLGTALFGKSPYEHVIVNGMVLAEDGKKMSKSLQNYPDPVDLANSTGVDAMRLYLLSAPIMRGEDLNFSEKEVMELQRKNIGRLHNVLAMYEMFADGTEARGDSTNVLDQWIVARLQQLVNDSTAGYKSYELDKATRPITDFIDDLSVWYLRRSRDRFKGEDVVDRTLALATLRHVLRTLSLTVAPSMPFYAEYLWQAIKEEDDAESVHLAAWPTEGMVNEDLLAQMAETRIIVTQALEARTKSGIKVRQPVAAVFGPELPAGLLDVVLDELNAKSYGVSDAVSIDIELTPELISEGAVRELMRAVQGARKTAGLEPQDEIVLTVQTDTVGQTAIAANQELLQRTVGATEVLFADTLGDEVAAGEHTFTFAIK